MKYVTHPVISNAMPLSVGSENNIIITVSYSADRILQKIILSGLCIIAFISFYLVKR
jgi:hypothetical protein